MAFSSDFKRQSKGDKLFDVVNVILILLILLIVLYPMYFVLIASVSDAKLVIAGRVLVIPLKMNIDAYKMVFKDSTIVTGYVNSLIYMVVGTSLNVFLTTLAAYPLSRSDLKGRGFFMGVLMVTMFFSGGLIPTYMIMNSLGFVNTIWGVIFPGAISVYNTIVMRTYFMNSIPVELQEAAQVDGCRNTVLLVKIIIPLSKPIIAVMLLFYGVGHWNGWFNALIYLNDSLKYPLQLVLRSILIQNQMSQEMLGDIDTLGDRVMLAETIKYALIVVATLPMMIIYPFLQRYFVKGVMVGAVKG